MLYNMKWFLSYSINVCSQQRSYCCPHKQENRRVAVVNNITVHAFNRSERKVVVDKTARKSSSQKCI